MSDSANSKPKFRVWDPINEAEEDGYDYFAWVDEDAAILYMENYIHRGEYLEADTFELHVRNLETQELTVVDVTVEYEPVAYTRRRSETP